MVSTEDTTAIRNIAARYDARKVILFGSSASSGDGKDIDLGVEGVRPADFFRFYGELMFALSKPVDLVDLSRDSFFTHNIRKDGVAVYERAKAKKMVPDTFSCQIKELRSCSAASDEPDGGGNND